MTKIHSVTLRYHKSNKTPVVLNYRQVAMGYRQPRLVGREALVPDISLDDYVCNAVIDWILIDLQLSRVTQQQWLAEAFEGFGRRPFIKPVDAGEGKESSHFTIKIQEPDIAQLRRIISALDRKYGLVSEPTVLGMEVSVDFTPKTPSNEARARLVGVLFRQLAPNADIFSNPQDMPRYSWGKGHRWARIQNAGGRYREPYRFAVNDIVNAPGADTTTYFGADSSDEMVRVMDKVLDQQNPFAGTNLELPPERQRCRVEVTLLQGKLEALGIRYLRDVAGFRFPTLQGLYFQFKLATVPARTKEPVATYRERERIEKFLATGISGLAKMDQMITTHSAALRPQVRRDLARKGKPLRSRPRTASGSYGTAVAYEQLCKKVQTALTNLARAVGSQESGEER